MATAAKAPQTQVQVLRGKVKWFNDQKGYGFIGREDGNGRDVFVHWRGIIGEEKHKKLIEGQTVEFNINETPKGDQAINVKVIANAT